MSMLSDGSIEWSIYGKIYRADAAIVEKMIAAYHDALARSESQPVKFAMEILINHHIIEDDRLVKNMSWHEVARTVGHEQ